MAISTLLVVTAVCLIFAIFALVLAVTDRSTTRWLRERDGNGASTRAAYPDRKGP